MSRRSLEKRLVYPQPHSIKCPHPFFLLNPALEYHLIMKEHRRLKYRAKYQRSKRSRRNYNHKK